MTIHTSNDTSIADKQGLVDVSAIIEDAMKNAPLIDWPSESERLAMSVRTYINTTPYAHDERFNYGEIVKHLKNRGVDE